MRLKEEKKMHITIVKSKEEAGKEAFKYVKEAIEKKEDSVLGLATGSTPEVLYEEMINSDVSFTEATAVNLDEYVGLDSDHPQSYHYFMEDQLFKHKPFKQTFVPDGTLGEEEAIKQYEDILEKHPIDVQILGIGVNGHIGFNEPGTSFDSTTHKVQLTEETINSNKRYFDSIDDVPKTAYTMGIHSIMKADKIILMAFGKEKAQAIVQSLEGEVTEDVPASILQKHPDLVVILDEEAASELSSAKQ